jgi:GT2 family glycosyltransferase
MSNVLFSVPKFKIFHSIPWNSEKNIGKSYNEMMSLVGSDDWVCFLDGDAVHTTPFFGVRIEEVVKKNGDYSLFTCYTNRIGCPYQIAPNVDQKNNDQQYHRNFGEKMWNNFGAEVIDVTKQSPMSGVLLLVKKSSWESVGGFKEEKMLSVDNDIHIKFTNNGFKSGLMKGIYVQHWYRGGNVNDKKHLL